MGKTGLLVLFIIQVFTGISMLLSSKHEKVIGIRTLSAELSIYRYLLASLWFSVSIVYITGFFMEDYYKGASLLAVANIVFEIISYWAGFAKNKNIPGWYPPAGTVVMAVPLVLIIAGNS